MGIQPSVNNHTIPTNPIRYKIGLLPDSYLTIAIRQCHLTTDPPPTHLRPDLLPSRLLPSPSDPSSCPLHSLHFTLPSPPLPPRPTIPPTLSPSPQHSVTFHRLCIPVQSVKFRLPSSPVPSPIRLDRDRRPDPLVLYTLPSMSSCSHGIRHRTHVVIPSAGGS